MISLLLVSMISLFHFSISYGVQGYEFELQYEGNILKNKEKEAVVILKGTQAPPYTNVRVKVEVKGPTLPKLIAIDSNGNQIDIAKEGYWGPVAGFGVGGDFENKTPIKATFSEEGEYTITLKLVDVANANTVLLSKTIQLQVFEDEEGNLNPDIPTQKEETTDTKVEELPKTGISIGEYVGYSLIFIAGIYLVIKWKKKSMHV